MTFRAIARIPFGKDRTTQRRDILYCEGPGDIVGAYKAWQHGADVLTETSTTFSGQLFDLCRLENRSAYALSYCSRAETFVDGNYTVTNMPRWECRIPKVGYEISMMVYAVRLLVLALRVRPKVIFVASGVSECLYLSLLRLSGAKIVPFLHNTLWPEGFPLTGLNAKFRSFGQRLFWHRCVAETIAVSPAAARQAESVGAKNAIVFRPSFPATAFAEIPPARNFSAPFRVMFAGRIEQNKGVFDILEIAEKLREKGRPIEFTLCGDGGALEAVEQAIVDRGLQDVVKTTGKLDRSALVERYLEAHVVIVPTRSNFAEGFAMVVAEAMLLLKPVVTSSVVPAAEVLKEAVVLAKTNDIESYVDAIAAISTDESDYQRLVENARRLRPFILDNSTSFFAALRSAMRRLDGLRIEEVGRGPRCLIERWHKR
jgi:glycogen(starch) synthase